MYRTRIIQLAFLLASIILIGKAAQLQLFNRALKEQATRTTLYKKTIYPSRGLIYDRNMSLMVTNEPIYDLEAIYNEIDPQMDTLLFCDLLDIDLTTFLNNVNKDWSSVRFNKSVAYTFLNKIEPKRFALFQEFLYLFPGFYPVLKNVRAYPHKSAAHVLGYIGEINESELKKSKKFYSPGDYVGVSGIEKTYEEELRGAKGVEYILKDNLGRSVGKLAQGQMDNPASSGINLQTTLDLVSQVFAEQLMSKKRGSVVAIEPSTGEVLVMLSAPFYDPNLLSIHKNRGEAFTRLLSDTINRPFMDRSLMAKYPPGSIFKPVLSLIAMEKGVLHPGRSMACNGRYIVNARTGFSQGCRNHPRPTDVSTALQWSCNSYFYQTVRDMIEIESASNPGVGLDILAESLGRFGLGTALGIDNLYENRGFVPTSAYFDHLYRIEVSGWRSTYILSLGIGQGELQLTTLQMANLAAILGNKGHYIKPHLVKSFINSQVNISEEYTQKINVGVRTEYFEPVITGMERVVSSGTARIAGIKDITVCGKTGTSQNPHGEDHSVFFGFAPKENPKIAIAVYVENAGSGGSLAAPIGSLIMQKYLQKEISNDRKWLVQYVLNKDFTTIP